MAARRRKRRGATTLGGWGHAHQRRRAAIAPLVIYLGNGEWQPLMTRVGVVEAMGPDLHSL